MFMPIFILLLMLREELICALILSFLIFYYTINKVKDKETLFPRLASIALAHIFFDAITILTVNLLGIVPAFLNRLLHIGFYLTGVLFGAQFLSYIIRIIRLSPPSKTSRMFHRAGYGLLCAFVVLMFVLPMEYVEGRGTNYSYGSLAFVGYSLFLLYCTTSLVLLITNRNKINRRTKLALIPTSMSMYIAVILQLLLPELLLSGGNLTLICIGLFVSLDNPDKDFIAQALWDFPSGLKNRNCYNRDLMKYTTHFPSGRIGFIVADLNYLKTVNDNYGHTEGDKLISAAAKTLRENLKDAENIYRIGGDEFTAVYLNPNDQSVQREIAQVNLACANTSDFAVPLSIAMGYASGPIREDVTDIFTAADEQMYEHKLRTKQDAPHLSPSR